jgi:hypothetical protein
MVFMNGPTQEMHLPPNFFDLTNALYEPIPINEKRADRVGRQAQTRGAVMLHEVSFALVI